MGYFVINCLVVQTLVKHRDIIPVQHPNQWFKHYPPLLSFFLSPFRYLSITHTHLLPPPGIAGGGRTARAREKGLFQCVTSHERLWTAPTRKGACFIVSLALAQLAFLSLFYFSPFFPPSTSSLSLSQCQLWRGSEPVGTCTEPVAGRKSDGAHRCAEPAWRSLCRSSLSSLEEKGYRT
jgi:hypothetical protein